MHNKERIFMESNAITHASWLFLIFSYFFYENKREKLLNC